MLLRKRPAVAAPLVQALSLGILALLGLSVSANAVWAADQPAPTVSRGLAKSLKAAQDALAAKNFPEAIAKVKEAQAQGQLAGMTIVVKTPTTAPASPMQRFASVLFGE